MSLSDVIDPQSMGEATDNDDVVVDSAVGGVVLLAANPGRRSALIINTGANTMRITTDGSVPTSTHGKQIVAGASLSMSPPYCPTKEVKACQQDAISTTANASEVD